MKFQPGNSGGPGRPKGTYLNPEAKKWAEQGGIALLLRIAGGRERGWAKAHRWDAIKLALAYGIGKPKEAVEITTAKEQIPRIDLSWATEEQLGALAGMARCPAECCSIENSGKVPPRLVIDGLTNNKE